MSDEQTPEYDADVIALAVDIAAALDLEDAELALPALQAFKTSLVSPLQAQASQLSSDLAVARGAWDVWMQRSTGALERVKQFKEGLQKIESLPEERAAEAQQVASETLQARP